MPYFNPHSLRSTLAQLGEQTCQTPEQFKAWSQNLGHEGVLTTFYSYGTVQPQRQGELIKELGQPRTKTASTNAEMIAAAVVRAIKSQVPHQGSR
mgnify:CR=1 FL=1